MVKTETNPGELPIEVFNGFRASYVAAVILRARSVPVSVRHGPHRSFVIYESSDSSGQETVSVIKPSVKAIERSDFQVTAGHSGGDIVTRWNLQSDY
jgi:hypothetical protein